MKIWTKLSPPTRPFEASTLDDEWGIPPPPPKPSLLARTKAWVKAHPYLATVCVPTAAAAVYFWVIASPQYVSEARFTVRAAIASPAAASGGGGMTAMMSGGGGGSALASMAEAINVRDYLESHDAVAALQKEANIVNIFRRPGADFLARLPFAHPQAEWLLWYYLRMVNVEFDSTTGMTTLTVKSFSPEDSKLLASDMLTLAEQLVNRLNLRMQEDGLRVAREELTRSEQRVLAASEALNAFREKQRALDPAAAAKVAIEGIGQLQAQLAQSQAALQSQLTFSKGDTPQIQQLRNRIAGLQQQISTLRTDNATGTDALTSQIAGYQPLMMEQEFAVRQLASATASLERARTEVMRQQVFIQRVVEPNLAQYALYPKRILNVLYLFIALSVAYALVWLVVAGMHEHAA